MVGEGSVTPTPETARAAAIVVVVVQSRSTQIVRTTIKKTEKLKTEEVNSIDCSAR